MKKETRNKLLEAISFIQNTAQEEQIYDTVVTNEWSFIEAHARELREMIDQLETMGEYVRRTDASKLGAKKNDKKV